MTFVCICRVCGVMFSHCGNQTGRYCSRACHSKDAAKNKPKVCSHCGREYYHSNKKQKFCCHNCYSLSVRGKEKTDPAVKTELKRKRNARHNHIKRARRRGNESERFDAAEIYERDQWVCHLCGKKIDSRLVWPDPMSPSIDHLVPSSLGGGHTRRNVKASHLRCNIQKHTRSKQEQLELYG